MVSAKTSFPARRPSFSQVLPGFTKGIWYFLGPFTFRKNNEARWVAVRYEDDYTKVNGGWKYKYLRAHIRMSAPPLKRVGPNRVKAHHSILPVREDRGERLYKVAAPTAADKTKRAATAA